MKIDEEGKSKKIHLMSLETKEYKEYKVPRLLWENLESVLLAQSKRYNGELAKRLGVSEKELQKKVLPTSDTLKVTIQDNQAESSGNNFAQWSGLAADDCAPFFVAQRGRSGYSTKSVGRVISPVSDRPEWIYPSEAYR